ncbi:DUF4974 domain-containing protein [Tamlana sp. s12]|uniref:FecR family protein n=1 Tax=Tamlana sp. s12 TaxID=1630406 RepID=UPI000839883A|nr:FecR family protein [Tamlana sp. s12]QQY82125.1 DUF4974 domain-containing protein [Tamlana sp. s12]
MSKKDKQHLLLLIDKLFDGSIKNRDRDKLFNFFLNNQKNKDWPEALDKDKIEASLFTKIKEEIANTPVKVIPLHKRPVFKWAVAASVLLFVSLGVFFANHNSFGGNASQVTVNSVIEIGAEKASLTLEDGSTVALTGNTFQKQNVVNQEGKLVYQSNSQKNKEVSYNYLTVPRGGEYAVVLADGTQVWLNSDSQLKFPVEFPEGERRVVELVYGEAYFDVSPSTRHNGASFIVVSENHEVEVLGTEFNVKSYKEEPVVKTTLVEGKVQINVQENVYTLEPNQQSILNKETHTVTVNNVDVFHDISWKSGQFSFNNKSLSEIMQVLSRWYDFEVDFKNKKVANEQFVGTLGKHEKIEDILENLKELKVLNSYQFDGKKIIIE